MHLNLATFKDEYPGLQFVTNWSVWILYKVCSQVGFLTSELLDSVSDYIPKPPSPKLGVLVVLWEDDDKDLISAYAATLLSGLF